MIITRGYGSKLVVTRGYGGEVIPVTVGKAKIYETKWLRDEDILAIIIAIDETY